MRHQRFVFLQHGVIKDDLSGWLERHKKNFFGFVTTALPEYDSIVSGNYNFPKENIWLTGLPRFDRLYHDEKKVITIMPTWRMYLFGAPDSETRIRPLKNDFMMSEYFLFYHGLLNHPKLKMAMEKYGYRLQFFPHPEVQNYLELFTKENIIPDKNVTYREIYAQSDLVLTDYSSACFDFAYLRKPIIYCQFDKEVFFSGEHIYVKGYFDYERDGFGEVEYDLESTVNRIIEYMENRCQLKDKYRQRIDNFFAYQDQNNCERLYQRIMECEQKRRR